jgi:hypothetical protein
VIHGGIRSKPTRNNMLASHRPECKGEGFWRA